MTGKTELMARPLRIAFRGELYLVTSRSDGRDDIYFSDQVQRLDVLVHVCERFNFSEPVASLIMGVGQKTRPDPLYLPTGPVSSPTTVEFRRHEIRVTTHRLRV